MFSRAHMRQRRLAASYRLTTALTSAHSPKLSGHGQVTKRLVIYVPRIMQTCRLIGVSFAPPHTCIASEAIEQQINTGPKLTQTPPSLLEMSRHWSISLQLWWNTPQYWSNPRNTWQKQRRFGRARTNIADRLDSKRSEFGRGRPKIGRTSEHWPDMLIEQTPASVGTAQFWSTPLWPNAPQMGSTPTQSWSQPCNIVFATCQIWYAAIQMWSNSLATADVSFRVRGRLRS